MTYNEEVNEVDAGTKSGVDPVTFARERAKGGGRVMSEREEMRRVAAGEIARESGMCLVPGCLLSVELDQRWLQWVVSCPHGRRVTVEDISVAARLADERAVRDVTTKEQHNPVNHPTHYTTGGVEVIDVIEAWELNYHRGNAVKYIARAGKKDPAKEIEDLRKAEWYVKREIARLEKNR